jgi:metallophosphoesterase superfamily enzyme
MTAGDSQHPPPNADADGDAVAERRDALADALAFRDRSLYVPTADALVVADVHVGRAEASDVSLPVGERRHLEERLDGLLDAFDPATVVVAGDLLHSFGYVPLVARRTLDALEGVVADADATLAVAAGNHDPQLAHVLDAPIREHIVLDGPTGAVRVSHGHEPPASDALHEAGDPDRHADDVALHVVGHEHPAIEIEGQKRPAALFAPGAADGADVLVLPAFTDLARGVTVNNLRASDFDAPLLAGARAIHPIVRDEATDDTLWFPPLSDLRPHL